MSQHFDNFYETTLLPELQHIEQERIASRNNKIIAIVIFIVIMAVAFIVSKSPFVIVAFVIVGVFAYNFAYNKDDSTLIKKYKEKIIQKSVAHFFENMKYSPYDGLDEVDFIALDLFDETPDSYSSEDLFSGVNDKTKYNFSEVHAQYKTERTYRDSNGNSRTETQWHDIFKGIIFCVDFNKNFNGSTLIMSNSFKLFDSDSRVKLENSEFEKLFDVYSNDQQEARYLITLSFMERFIELRNKFGDIKGSFRNSSLYITIPFSADAFEMDIWSTVLNKQRLQFEVNLIYNLVSIVDTLDLNTRIWTKN